MVARKKDGALTDEEKPIVKALLADGWRNQDIQALVNTGRQATINSARITEVKNDGTIVAANIEEIEFFKIRKDSYDPKTGLNLFDHERLIRAREAMVLAVQVFNSLHLGCCYQIKVAFSVRPTRFRRGKRYSKCLGATQVGGSFVPSQAWRRVYFSSAENW